MSPRESVYVMVAISFVWVGVWALLGLLNTVYLSFWFGVILGSAFVGHDWHRNNTGCFDKKTAGCGRSAGGRC